VKPTISRRGNAYTTFQVSDSSGVAVKVFIWGHGAVSSSDAVRVTGTFHRVKRVGQSTFYNEIEASRVLPLK
jgi:hypothetical protein